MDRANEEWYEKLDDFDYEDFNNEPVESDEYKAAVDTLKIQEIQDYQNYIKADNFLKIKYKKRFSKRIFWLSISWLIYIGVIVLVKALFPSYFILSDNVLITLITTTTATIFGLFYLVISHFFPNDPKITIDGNFKTK